MTTANEPQPSDASDLLAAWTPTLNAVLAWLETAQCDFTGLGFTPAERLQLNEKWRREQRPRGRLGTLTAFATKADALSSGSGPASRLLALLRAHEMPTAGTLAAAAEEARGALARSMARPETANPGTARPGKSVLDLFKAMDLMWMSIHLHNGDDAEEAYDALFGPEEQRTAMLALYERREEFVQRFPGTVQTIADFAVTSGHEAAALFAGRIAAFAPAREGWIPKHRDDLRQAKATGRESAIGTARFHLKEAVRDFADFMKPAFKGWFEHRAWIRRSIEQELESVGRKVDERAPTRSKKDGPKALSDMTILVLRAIPGSQQEAVRTLDEIADRVGTFPKPSTSSICRAIGRLRKYRPPLADAASYRRTKAGDAQATQ